MGSRSPDLQLFRMDEEGEASTLRSCTVDAAGSGSMEGNVELQQCFPPSLQDIDNKENIFKVPASKRKKAGVCNMRKSLAWNPAFLTEEGVLDPLEMSILGGSLTNRNGCSISQSDGEMTPLKGLQKSGDRHVLHDAEGNICGKSYRERKGVKGANLFSNQEVSTQEEHQEHVSLGKINSCKRIARGTPRLPAAYSQKRVANTNATNPALKLPKVTPMKSEAFSISMTSRSTISTTKNSKVNHNVTTGSGTSNTVNGEQSLDVKGFSSNLKKLSSAKSSEHGLCKRVVRTNNLIADKQVGCNVTPIALSSVQDKQVGSNVTPIALSSVQVQERINSAVSAKAKALSSYALNGHDVPGGPPATHVKPSALRMPSPSLGYFCQGKVTPSFATDSRRNMEKSLSNVPPRKPITLKQTNDSKPVHVSAEGKSVAVKRCATSILSGSSKSSWIASSLPSSGLAVDIHSFVGKSSVMQICRASGNSSCVSSSQEPSKFACLLVDNSPNSPGLEKHDVGRVKVPYEDKNTLQVDSRTHVEENTIIMQPLKDSFSRSKRPDGNKFPSENVSMDICIPEVMCERQSKPIFEDEIGEDNLIKNLPVGDARGETSVSISEGKQSAENSNSVPAIGSQCTSRDIELASSLEPYSSFKLNKEQAAVVGTIGDEMSDCLLGKNVVMPAGRADLSSTLLEDKNYRLQFDKNNPISLKNDESFIPIKNETVNEFRADSLALKHQQNLIPFSDEWLAAREAFGKEILELKTGPVKHSPTEKSIPEPSPWSPVKRKHQEVGPFDCTKYSKDPSTLDTQ